MATRTPDPVPVPPAYLDLRSVEPTATHEFLVALVPARTPEAANIAADRFATLDEGPWHGIETTRGTFRDVVLFRARGAAGAARHRDWTVDADTWSVTRDGATVVQMSGHRLTTLMQADRILVRADRPVSLIGRYHPGDLTVICTAREATPLTLAVGGVPSRVQVNGRVVAARIDRSNLTGQSVTIDLPAGSHELRIGIEPGPSQPREAAKSGKEAR
jgi:hypothetical protein